MFVAYPLYVIHALGIHDGFGFSAGAIDYLLNFRIAQQPVLLLLIGLAYGVLYYFLFRFVIVKWNLHTPGREVDGETADINNVLVDQPR
jgi:PTS system N-acetylglucosamine-specific IIC component